MTETVPAWLISGFARSTTNLGATAGREEVERVAEDLATIWSAPGRFFHNLNHLKDTLENVDFLAEQARDIDALRLAAWFHGAAFDVSPSAVAQGEGGIDIPASARFATEKLSSLGMSVEAVAKIAALIESLYRHKASEDIDAQVLSDADLAVLGADPEDYLDYLRSIREEYRAYSDAEFRQTRLRIVESLLARPQLFYTHMAGAWEDQARENLRAEQERLQKATEEGTTNTEASSGETKTSPENTPATTEEISSTGAAADSPQTGEVNPLAPIDDADLGSTLENVEEIMDTLVMKAIKTKESPLKPMSNPEK